MSVESLIKKATAIVLNREAKILDDLYAKANPDDAPQTAVDKLFDEVDRQCDKGRFDEEEWRLGNLILKRGR